MSQNDFIEVHVVLSPTAAPRPAFGPSLMLQNLTDAQGAAMVNRTALVTSDTWPADLAALGITDGEPAYEQVQSYFSQQQKSEKGYLGRRGKDIQQVWNVQVPAVPADGTYIVSVNGVPYSFVAATSTQAAVRTGLIAAMASGSATFTATSGVPVGQIILTSVAAGPPGLTVLVQSPASSMTAAIASGTSVLTVAQVWTMTIVTATPGTYKLTVQTTTGQKTYTYIAIATDTTTTIRSGLKTLYDANPSDLFGITMTTVGGNQGTLTAATAGVPGSVSITSPLGDATTVVTIANYGIADDWAAMVAANQDWYCGLLAYATDAELELSAAFFEGEDHHLLGMQTADANILTTPSTSVYGKLAAKKYLRSWGVQHPTDAEGVAAAWASNVLTTPCGGVTWTARPITGFTGRVLTASANAAARSVETSFLELFAAQDRSVMNGGFSFAGRPIDITRAIDTFRSELTLGLMDLLVGNRIVPYSSVGQEMCRGVILNVINGAVSAGYMIQDSATITFAPISSASGSDRQRGIFPPFNVKATIQAGATKIIVDVELSQ